MAREVGATDLEVYSDSQLVVRQISGEYQTKGERLAAYVTRAREMLQTFAAHSIRQIPRKQNVFADTLAKLATDAEAELAGLVPVNHLPIPSIRAPTVDTVDHSASWMGLLIRYLSTGEVPNDRAAARKLLYQAHRYVMMDGKLYRRGLSMPYLRCVSGTELGAIMYEVHEGFCGDHTAGPSLSKKILCQGYFWPTMKKDCIDYVRKCEQCQRYVKIPWAPPTEITLMISP